MQPTGNLIADTVCRTAELGVSITDAADAATVTIINAVPVGVDDTCPDCGTLGTRRDHVTRRLVDLPVVGFPTRLHLRVPRFACTQSSCDRRIFRPSLPCAEDGAKLTHRVTCWILQRLAVDKMSVSVTATAVDDALPAVLTVMDPFHVVHLAAPRSSPGVGNACNVKPPDAEAARKTRCTRTAGGLTDQDDVAHQTAETAPGDGGPLMTTTSGIQVTWSFYQQIITAYGQPNKAEGKKLIDAMIATLHTGLPKGVEELAQLRRTMFKRRQDILGYFDLGASNGLVEAINGRLEHLRGIALGFRNLGNYILRSLIRSAGLQALINALQNAKSQ